MNMEMHVQPGRCIFWPKAGSVSPCKVEIDSCPFYLVQGTSVEKVTERYNGIIIDSKHSGIVDLKDLKKLWHA